MVIIKKDPLKEKNKDSADELDRLFKKSNKKGFDEIMDVLDEYEKDSPKRAERDSFDE